MDVLKTWCSRFWAHLRFLGRRGRVVGLFLVAMVVAGGVLLLASAGGDGWVPVQADPLPAEQQAAARWLLEEHGIRFRFESQRLLIRRQDRQRVRATLARHRLLGGRAASTFEKLADEEDIWQTQAQSAKRWQAAKMAELSKLICEFPPVLRATVILEPGAPRRLGAPAVPPTAAVHVTMRERAGMTPKLARAIADLVAGSVAGMKASDVRIVDSSGQSFRIAEEGPTTRPATDGLQFAGADPVGGTGADAREPAPGAVFEPAAEAATDDTGGTAGLAGWLGAAAVLGVAATAWLVFRRRSRRHGEAAPTSDLDDVERPHPDEPAGPGAALPGEDTEPGGRFAFLRAVPPAELAGLLELEHPQTLAIILGHLPPQSAGSVLARLSEEKKVEVARRVADLSQVDPGVVAEIEQALSARLAEAGRRQQVCGGLTTIAQILQHSGYATETSVLEALAAQQPALAERIRRRLLAFEDLADVPAEPLRAALAGFGSQELAVALRAAGKNLKRQILSCLPGPAARQVRREMDQMGPVRLSDVEGAQQRIVDAVRRLGVEAHCPIEIPQTGPHAA